MELIDPAINQYIESHTTQESAVLQELNRETYAHVLRAHMLSGHVQGRLLAMFPQMIHPAAILEIGTFTGYSALCLAEGLQEGGKVYTIDINEELEEMVGYFAKAGIANKIEYIIGNAIDIIPTLVPTFDLVFIDADKKNCSRYYDLVFDKVRPGGYIIADNVLWKGKVVNTQKIDTDTQIILDFNTKVQQDTRVENILLPVRDGLMVARKK